MDEMDLRILRILQDDSRLSISQIGRRVGLSPSPCWKRIKRMEKEGIIKGQTATLDAQRLGLGLIVFVSIKTGEHSSDWLKNFSKTVVEMPEVIEFYRMAGDVDYMLKVLVRDMSAFDNFYKRLIGNNVLSDVTSRFSIETIKETSSLPI